MNQDSKLACINSMFLLVVYTEVECVRSCVFVYGYKAAAQRIGHTTNLLTSNMAFDLALFQYMDSHRSKRGGIIQLQLQVLASTIITSLNKVYILIQSVSFIIIFSHLK